MTPTEQALSNIIDGLLQHVEELGCTCATAERYNRLHCTPGRRRKDSTCTGVGLAVTADMQRRRALKLKGRKEDA